MTREPFKYKDIRPDPTGLQKLLDRLQHAENDRERGALIRVLLCIMYNVCLYLTI
jgi:hypothetical protein